MEIVNIESLNSIILTFVCVQDLVAINNLINFIVYTTKKKTSMMN
jgi:hypothetical protein